MPPKKRKAQDDHPAAPPPTRRMTRSAKSEHTPLEAATAEVQPPTKQTSVSKASKRTRSPDNVSFNASSKLSSQRAFVQDAKAEEDATKPTNPTSRGAKNMSTDSFELASKQTETPNGEVEITSKPITRSARSAKLESAQSSRPSSRRVSTQDDRVAETSESVQLASRASETVSAKSSDASPRRTSVQETPAEGPLKATQDTLRVPENVASKSSQHSSRHASVQEDGIREDSRPKPLQRAPSDFSAKLSRTPSPQPSIHEDQSAASSQPSEQNQPALVPEDGLGKSTRSKMQRLQPKSIQGESGESPRPTTRSRRTKTGSQTTDQDAQETAFEHSVATLPSIEDFPAAPPGHGRKRKAQVTSGDDVESNLPNGEEEEVQEAEVRSLKRARTQARTVDSEIDAVDTEQPQETEPPTKKRRPPPGRAGGPRKSKGKGRGRRRANNIESIFPNIEDTPYITSLKDRQKALNDEYKKLVAPHKEALSVMTDRNLESLKKSKDAHKEVPEYVNVNKDLMDLLAERQAVIEKEYELKVEQATKMMEAERETIQQRHRNHVSHIWQETLRGAMFDYMTYMDSIRQADDDDATVMEESFPGPPPSIRGYNIIDTGPGSGNRDMLIPHVLDSHEKWPDFVHREEMRQHAGPLWEENQSEMRKTIETDATNLSHLAEAGVKVEKQQLPPAHARSNEQLAQDESAAVEALACLRGGQVEGPAEMNNLPPQLDGAADFNHYQHPSPNSKRRQRSGSALKPKSRSGSLGQRALLPAPEPAVASAPYVFANQPFIQYHGPPAPPGPPGPPITPTRLPQFNILPPPVPVQTSPSYHSLPPPPPSMLQHPLAHHLFAAGQPPIFPRPPPPLPPPLTHQHGHGHPPPIQPFFPPQAPPSPFLVQRNPGASRPPPLAPQPPPPHPHSHHQSPPIPRPL